MKIYTKQGDQGDTRLYGGARVAKDNDRIEAYGTLDELCALLGLVRSQSRPPEVDELLRTIQNDLFVMGAQLAAPDAAEHSSGQIGAADIERLEAAIDQREVRLPTLCNFILPGGTPTAATLHVARVVCRRAERRVVTLARQSTISPAIVPYLNRLGDLLFVMARSANADAGVADVPWRP